MLIITRKIGQIVYIELAPGVDPMTPVGDIFAQRSIEIIVAQVNGARVRLGISTPLSLAILRQELKLAAS